MIVEWEEEGGRVVRCGCVCVWVRQGGRRKEGTREGGGGGRGTGLGTSFSCKVAAPRSGDVAIVAQALVVTTPGSQLLSVTCGCGVGAAVVRSSKALSKCPYYAHHV